MELGYNLAIWGEAFSQAKKDSLLIVLVTVTNKIVTERKGKKERGCYNPGPSVSDDRRAVIGTDE